MNWAPGTKVEFQVRGFEPVAKGNLQAFLVRAPGTKTGWRAVLTDSKSQDLKAWEKRLHEAALAELARRGLAMSSERPVEVHLVLWLIRVKADFDTSHQLRGLARAWPHVKPDIDKLQRTIFDALTACVIDDDSRICRVVVEKRYVETEAQAGVAVRVIALPATIREATQCALSS